AFWERFLIPAFVHFFRLLYPFERVNKPSDRLAGGAGGCMLVRRKNLQLAGGMESIRGAIIDDCSLAARLKRTGPIRLELTKDSHSLRGYDGLDGILKMIRRTAYTQLKHSPALLAGCLAGMALVFLVPVLGTILLPSVWRLVPLAAWVLMSATYVPMLRFYGASLLQAPLLPVVALFYLKATLDSARAHHAGRGAEWKGRVRG
ncbi:MAG: glycosyltransferase, partial [Verrucomicrobiota bacterium JB024]|nr:glycosyltransferase [Verrucomicrobiota bacterium JB024]